MKTIAGRTLSFCLLISLIGAIFYANNVLDSKTPSSNLCDITNQSCLLSIGSYQLKVEFQSKPEIEEQLYLTVNAPKTAQIENISIKGINMFMGVIPVAFDSMQDDKWKGWTYLGACSEPNMVWEISIKLKGEDERGRLKFTTTSS